MEHSIFSPKVLKSDLTVESQQHPYEKFSWSKMTDEQKAQLLLGCMRMHDNEIFLREFKSWETPDAAY